MDNPPSQAIVDWAAWRNGIASLSGQRNMVKIPGSSPVVVVFFVSFCVYLSQ